MRLTPEAHDNLQEFFRVHYDDAGLVLPEIDWQKGTAAQGVTRGFRITAMTLGRRVLLDAKALRCDTDGRWWIKSRLAAHEATHVLQYQRQGWGGFLFRYLSEYAQTMQQAARWDSQSHATAYNALSAEREARELEAAYRLWRGHDEEELLP